MMPSIVRQRNTPPYFSHCWQPDFRSVNSIFCRRKLVASGTRPTHGVQYSSDKLSNKDKLLSLWFLAGGIFIYSQTPVLITVTCCGYRSKKASVKTRQKFFLAFCFRRRFSFIVWFTQWLFMSRLGREISCSLPKNLCYSALWYNLSTKRKGRSL